MMHDTSRRAEHDGMEPMRGANEQQGLIPRHDSSRISSEVSWQRNWVNAATSCISVMRTMPEYTQILVAGDLKWPQKEFSPCGPDHPWDVRPLQRDHQFAGHLYWQRFPNSSACNPNQIFSPLPRLLECNHAVATPQIPYTMDAGDNREQSPASGPSRPDDCHPNCSLWSFPQACTSVKIPNEVRQETGFMPSRSSLYEPYIYNGMQYCPVAQAQRAQILPRLQPSCVHSMASTFSANDCILCVNEVEISAIGVAAAPEVSSDLFVILPERPQSMPSEACRVHKR
eukprot:4789566-Pleurochrysis_carterae.AAC.1